MSTTVQGAEAEVPQAEVERRIAEYRQAMADRLAAAVVVYHEPCSYCPWSDCALRILGIQFHLDEMIPEVNLRAKMLTDFWIGPGLVARCPRCHRHVAYEVLQKRAVPAIDATMSVLPDDWHRVAYVVRRESNAALP